MADMVLKHYLVIVTNDRYWPVVVDEKADQDIGMVLLFNTMTDAAEFGRLIKQKNAGLSSICIADVVIERDAALYVRMQTPNRYALFVGPKGLATAPLAVLGKRRRLRVRQHND